MKGIENSKWPIPKRPVRTTVITFLVLLALIGTAVAGLIVGGCSSQQKQHFAKPPVAGQLYILDDVEDRYRENKGAQYLYLENKSKGGKSTSMESDDGHFRGRDVALPMFKNPPGFTELGGARANNPPIGTLKPGEGKGWKVVAELDIPACNAGNTYPSFRKLENPSSKGTFWIADYTVTEYYMAHPDAPELKL